MTNADDLLMDFIFDQEHLLVDLNMLTIDREAVKRQCKIILDYLSKYRYLYMATEHTHRPLIMQRIAQRARSDNRDFQRMQTLIEQMNQSRERIAEFRRQMQQM